MSDLTFTATDHYAFTVTCEDVGVNFRFDNGCLYGGVPTGRQMYAENWRLLAALDDRNEKVVRMYEAGEALEYEADGIIAGAVAALNA